jgi:predicted GNAT family N-acyltransferase
MLTCKKADTLAEFIDAIRLRVDVFIREQGFQPGWEPDEDDKVSEHFIALLDGEVVSTTRYRWTAPGEVKLERMATDKNKRSQGVGTALLEYVLTELRQLNPGRIWLRSQVASQRFYENCGFAPSSQPYEMWGIPHIDLDYTKRQKAAYGLL